MKVECPGCKAIVAEDEFAQCHSVYRCRRDHVFACCKAECQRVFEKRCLKVAEIVHKTQHKLNNDGHTSALRRLPPGEREKFKQFSEAESNGWLICPEEAKASERSVPFCSHVCMRTGGAALEDERLSPEETQQSPQPPPPKLDKPDKPHGEKQLLSDDMLVEIRRDDEMEEEEMVTKGSSVGKSKKTPKSAKNKKGQQLILDWTITSPSGNPVGEEGTVPDNWAKPGGAVAAPSPWQTKSSPGGLGAAQVWSTVASRNTTIEAAERSALDAFQPRQGAPLGFGAGIAASIGVARVPPDAAQRQKAPVEAKGVEARAAELLTNWEAERAGDPVFQPPNSSIAGTFAAAAAGARAAQAAAAVAAGSGGSDSSPTSGRGAQRPPAASPQAQPPQQAPASQPLPLPLPQQAPPQQPPQLQPPPQQQQQQQQQPFAVEQMLPRPQTSSVQAAATTAPPVQPPPPPLPPDWQAVWSDEQKAYYFWHKPTNDTTWDAPAMPVPMAAALLGAESSESDTGPGSEAGGRATSGDRCSDRVVHARAAAPGAGRGISILVRAVKDKPPEAQPQPAAQVGDRDCGGPDPGALSVNQQYLCAHHWRPRADLKACLRLFQGERVRLLWTDGQKDGWGWGAALEEPEKEGYFPQSMLRVARRPASSLQKGDLCSVAERFTAPEEVGGYVSVEPGDSVRVLYSSKDPFAWVFVERRAPHAQPEVGWAPECALIGPQDRHGAAGPNPAG